MRNEHSARRRGRFTAHAYPHYQIRIFTLLNTCFRFNAHTYPHYQLRVFTLLNTYIHFTEYVHLHYRTRISTLPNTCICIIKYTFPHHRTRISTLPNTCIHTTARTFPPPFLWVNTDMRARYIGLLRLPMGGNTPLLPYSTTTNCRRRWLLLCSFRGRTRNELLWN